MTTDPIAAARALLDKVPPLFIDLDGDLCRAGDGYNLVGCAATDDEPPFGYLNPAIWFAIPALRDMVATLVDTAEVERVLRQIADDWWIMAQDGQEEALKRTEKAEIERDRAFAESQAKVAAAYEAAATEADQVVAIWEAVMAIRALTPSDAQAALDKLLAEARLEGWRAGRDAAADEAKSCTHDPHVVRAISALPEPKETSHDD